jgi:hypothetical protein
MRREETLKDVPVTCYGIDPDPFTCKVRNPELPGEYCFPPLASLITPPPLTFSHERLLQRVRGWRENEREDMPRGTGLCCAAVARALGLRKPGRARRAGELLTASGRSNLAPTRQERRRFGGSGLTAVVRARRGSGN